MTSKARAVADVENVKVAEAWRLTSDFESDGTITGWEVVDENVSATLGTGLTESSGVFSFPSTGMWMILANPRLVPSSNDSTINCSLETSDDGGSGFSAHTLCQFANDTTSGAVSASGHALVNCDSTSNVKFRFVASSVGTGSVIGGNTNNGETHFSVIRLGNAV